MKNKQEIFDIKNQKIQNLEVKSSSNILYIADENRVQRDVKRAKERIICFSKIKLKIKMLSEKGGKKC